jgi:hypothetical protein
MATTITRGATTLTPTAVTDWETTRETGNIVHQVIGTGDPSVTFAATRLRTGKLSLVCATLALALSVDALHAAPGPLTITNTDVGLSMLYAVTGAVTVSQDKDSDTWLVTVEFSEII